MNQATLDLDHLPADHADRCGFELGWDHAHHGLVPPAGLLLEGTPVSQGWRAGKAVFGPRTLGSGPAVRQWLQLRTDAWLHGRAFERLQVTPHYLAQIGVTHCPVTRQALGGAPTSDQAPVIVRLFDDAGYAAGNLAVLSRAAAHAKADCSLADAQRHAAAIESGEADSLHGLDAPAWRRLATLMSFVTPLSPLEAARLPLCVLPPNRVRVLNAAQGLQALLTLQFAAPGWSRRLRAAASCLADPALRNDFNLWVGALAPRRLAAEDGSGPRALRLALEDAWGDARVNRRWQHFVAQLDGPAAEALLHRLAAAGLAGVHTQWHDAGSATEGWALATRGLVQPRKQPRRVRPLAQTATVSAGLSARAG